MKYLTFKHGDVWTCLAYMSEQFNLNKSDYQWFGQCGGAFRFIDNGQNYDFDTQLMTLEHINYSVRDWGVHLEMVPVSDYKTLLHLLEVCPDWLLFSANNQWVVIDDNKGKLFGAWVARYSNKNEPSYRWYNSHMFQRNLEFPLYVYRLADGGVTGFKDDYQRFLDNFNHYYQQVIDAKDNIKTVADLLDFSQKYVLVFVDRFLEINGRFSNDFVAFVKEFKQNYSNHFEISVFMRILDWYHKLLIDYKQGCNYIC